MEEELGHENSLKDEEVEEVEAVIVTSADSESGVTEEDFAHFIGENADKYLPKFRKFNVNGVDKFSMTWHWPAFFFGHTWIAYRKMYVWALVAFLLVGIATNLGLLLTLPFSTSILFGVTGNYIYYRHAKKKILELKSTQIFPDTTEKPITLQKIGGINVWAAILAIAITFIFGLSMGGSFWIKWG